MTIQKTMLFSIASLLLASSASAQPTCSRRVVIQPSHHHHHYGHPTPIVINRGVSRITPIISAHLTHGSYPQGGYVTAGLAPMPSQIAFGSFSHVDELASRLEVLMNELCLDMYYNYSHNPGFQETYTEAYSLFQTARYIHASEHNYDRDEICRLIGGADALFHHIQEDVRGWSRVPNRQIGALGILTKMEMTEETIHHLMDDLGVSATPGLEEPPAPGLLNAPLPLSLPPAPPQLR